MKPLTVADLIAFLQTQPQDLPVCYHLHSEFCLLETDDISVRQLQAHRPDGWIHSARPDKRTVAYLVLPGN